MGDAAGDADGRLLLVFVLMCPLLGFADALVLGLIGGVVRRFHLKPARHYPRIFIEAAGNNRGHPTLAPGWCGLALRLNSVH
jgi:hypothetical protein